MNHFCNTPAAKKTVMTQTLTLRGTSYEIGFRSGKRAEAVPKLRSLYTSPFPGFTREDFKNAESLFSRWCPGLNEEIAGFADALGTAAESVVFYAMTYLRPNCSQIALSPQMTKDGHPLLARSYEFNDEMEDFTLVKTCVEGKFSHIGTSVLTFGRDEGMNSEGLAVTMSSCGFPVGAQPGMRRPAVPGLQFWSVSRSVLENCSDVGEALLLLKEMPIAYNLNLIVADRFGRAALFETLDGRKAVRETDPASLPWLCATNHACLDELIPVEPQAMRHSLERYRWIQKMLDDAGQVDKEALKDMLLRPYPDGLCCHYYTDFFGTTKSLILDPAEGSLELCWGGRAENGWQHFLLAEDPEEAELPIELHVEPAPQALFTMAPIR